MQIHRLANTRSPWWLAAPYDFFRRRILGKIVLPYLLLVGIIALFFSYVTIDVVATSLEDKFREELADAGRAANEAMVKVEDRHLTILRAMRFTVGVDRAIAERDAETLQALLGPLMVSHRVGYVDVLSSAGDAFLALRSPELGRAYGTAGSPNVENWRPVLSVRTMSSDPEGEQFSGMVDAPWGPLFVVAAPVRWDGELAGVISIASPMEEVTATLSAEAGSKPLTLYRPDGHVLASTVRAVPERLSSYLTLPPELAARFDAGDRIVVRRTAIDERPYVEAIGVLAIRRQPALLLGVGNVVSIIDERIAQAGRIIVPVAVLCGGLVMGIGLLLANGISRPVRTLVEATNRIRRNELDFSVPVQTADEVGLLSEAFNETLVGLRERQRSQIAIERYMSPQVYQLIQQHRLELGGTTRPITVIKSDIRDFTMLSGTMDAPTLVEFLNRYFRRMVTAITKYGGEVDKFMGDSILAKFGATEPDAAHPVHAVLAMLEMLEQCERLNHELRREGLPTIRMGIGVNTGEAVVGNIGSEERMEYTIISEAVNVAQRIEEQCKQLGWDLLISEATYEQVMDVIEVGASWPVELRGVRRPLRVYPVLGRASDVPPSRRRAYDQLLGRREVPLALVRRSDGLIDGS